MPVGNRCSMASICPGSAASTWGSRPFRSRRLMNRSVCSSRPSLALWQCSRICASIVRLVGSSSGMSSSSSWRIWNAEVSSAIDVSTWVRNSTVSVCPNSVCAVASSFWLARTALSVWINAFTARWLSASEILQRLGRASRFVAGMGDRPDAGRCRLLPPAAVIQVPAAADHHDTADHPPHRAARARRRVRWPTRSPRRPSRPRSSLGRTSLSMIFWTSESDSGNPSAPVVAVRPVVHRHRQHQVAAAEPGQLAACCSAHCWPVWPSKVLV